MDALESQSRQAAKKEEVVEMKKTMFKPLQEKQDQMDDRLKRIERGGLVTAGGRGGGGGGGNGGDVGGAVTAGGGETKSYPIRMALSCCLGTILKFLGHSALFTVEPLKHKLLLTQ